MTFDEWFNKYAPTAPEYLDDCVRDAWEAATSAKLEEERAECEEQARLNGMGAEREAALLANVEMLERELAKANKLAADRLEQMNADRKAYLDLKQKIDSEGIKE